MYNWKQSYVLVPLILRPGRVALTLLREGSLDQTIADALRLHKAGTPSHKTHANFVVQVRQVQLSFLPGQYNRIRLTSREIPRQNIATLTD